MRYAFQEYFVKSIYSIALEKKEKKIVGKNAKYISQCERHTVEIAEFYCHDFAAKISSN